MAAPILPVASINLAPPAALAPSVAAPGPASGSPFSSVFAEAVQQVTVFQNNADASINRFLSGEGEEIHKVALASQQADLSFQLFMQIRNKVVSAYQEVMRMQV